VENVHQIHHNDNSIEWSHVLREANQVADRLAKHGLSLNIDFKIFNVVPSLISLPL
jgi:ribonuclease HI